MDSLHFASSKKNSDQLRLRDVSFSSYLKEAGEDESEINVFDAKKYFSDSTDWKELGNRSLFPAIIHGNNQNGSCDLSEINRFSSVSSVEAGGFGRNVKAGSLHATPTASSEASWNSQTGLLSNPPGAIAVSLKNVSGDLEKRRGSASAAAKWFFCRSKCPCSGKKSVQVEEAIRNGHNDQQKIVLEERNQNLALKVQVSPPETGHGVLLSPGLRRPFAGENPLASSGGFSFPILNPSSQAAGTPVAVAKMTIKTSDIEDQIPPKNSLEIFQPPISRKSLDAIQLSPQPRGGGGVDSRDRRAGNFGFPGSPISRVTATDDDVGSDASSDLFEIESFSTQTTSYPMYRRRDSLDDEGTFNARRFSAANNLYGGRRSLDEPATPSVAATENYPPSEVSIDWSVTTAEGLTNFSMTASEMEEHVGGGGGRQWLSEYGGGVKCKGSGLLSCRQEKAVSVGPQPQPQPQAVKAVIGPETATAAAPVVALISTGSHVSGRPPKPNKPPLAASHSARLSLAFAA